MTFKIKEFINSLKNRLPAEKEIPVSFIQELDQQIERSPNHPELYILKGQLILNSEDDPHYQLQDALTAFEKAVEINPNYAEGYLEIAYFLDTFNDDFKEAIKNFELAISHKPSDDAYIGLARCLAQIGKKNEAIEILKNKANSDNADVEEMIDEIQDGVWDLE